MKYKDLKSTLSVVETEQRYPNFPYNEESFLKDSLTSSLINLGLDKDNPFSSYVKRGGYNKAKLGKG